MPSARLGSRFQVFLRLQSALSPGLTAARIASLAAEGAAWSESRVAAEGQAVCQRIGEPPLARFSNRHSDPGATPLP